MKQLIYADDALYMAESIADLQLMFDTCWMMMTMMGLQIMIKGKKKTAFMATYWKDGKQTTSIWERSRCDYPTDAWYRRYIWEQMRRAIRSPCNEGRRTGSMGNARRCGGDKARRMRW